MIDHITVNRGVVLYVRPYHHQLRGGLFLIMLVSVMAMFALMLMLIVMVIVIMMMIVIMIAMMMWFDRGSFLFHNFLLNEEGVVALWRFRVGRGRRNQCRRA